MAEAGMEIFVGTAVALAFTVAIMFGERAYRYRRITDKKHAGTYGFKYEGAAEAKE